jgi:hypothetical protein
MVTRTVLIYQILRYDTTMCKQHDCPICQLEDQKFDIVAPVPADDTLDEFMAAQLGPTDYRSSPEFSSVPPSVPVSTRSGPVGAG